MAHFLEERKKTMGADLYWEEKNWKQPPPRAHWEDEILVVEKQRFYYYDWVEVWRGEVNDETLPLLKIMGVKIPTQETLF